MKDERQINQSNEDGCQKDENPEVESIEAEKKTEVVENKYADDAYEDKDSVEKDCVEEDSVEEDFEDEDSEEPRRPRRLTKILALLVIIAFLGISLPNIPYLLSDKLGFLDESQSLLDDDLVQRCRPAVVSVEAQLKADTMQASTVKQGTGFNISPTGRIITNQHVVDGADTITITFADGSTYYSSSCKIIPDTDIAIVTIAGKGLPVLKLNRADPIQEGQTVTVIGNPLGYDKIAQRGRVGKYHQIQESTVPVFDVAIQINPGNSGSPVINEKGEVIGVLFASATTVGESTSEKIALAIPLDALPSEYFTQP